MNEKKAYKEKQKSEVEAIQYIGTNQDKLIEFGEGMISVVDNELVFKTSLDVIKINVGDFVSKNSNKYPAFIVTPSEQFLASYEEKKA